MNIFFPDQPVFANYNSATTKNARRIADQLLCLPLYENLTEDDVNTVLEGVGPSLMETHLERGSFQRNGSTSHRCSSVFKVEQLARNSGGEGPVSVCTWTTVTLCRRW